MEPSTALLPEDRPSPIAPGAEAFAAYLGPRRPPLFRQPWTLWRYMAVEVLRIVVLGVVAISVLYTAVVAYQTVRGGLRLSLVWPFLLKVSSYPLYASLPLSLLFGITLSLGRMVADLEVDAMRAHGMSHRQIYAPFLALGLLVAAAGYVANHWLVPELHYEKRNLEQYVIRQLENLGSGVNRTILLPEDGGSLQVGAYQGTHLQRVHIDLYRRLQSRFVPSIRERLPDKLPEKVTILAREGRLEILEDRSGIVLHLHGVQVLVPETVTGTPTGTDKFHHRFAITESLAVPLTFERKERGIKDLPLPELVERIRELERGAVETQGPEREAAERRLGRARAEYHRRFAFSLSAVTLALAGTGIALLLRHKSRLVPFLAGNVVAIAFFYPLLMVGTALAERGIAPALSLSLPNLVLLAVGVELYRRAARQ